MPEIHALLPYVVHLGAIFFLICFLFRNQLYLRSFAILGSLAYIAYYYGVTSEPLWAPMVYSSLNIATNLVMIGLILRDQREGQFGEGDLQLFRRLSPLNPGEFRRLMRGGTWQQAEGSTQITTEGAALDRLYFVMDGDIEIEKSGRKITPDSGIFIGEIAFLSNKPATATVTLRPGARYVSWDSNALRQQLARDSALQHGMLKLLNADLMTKVARG
ncbi:MAG: cyclic nucleotide-binding domain-containing protein [Proteobacteria bacterium]|nr:cyclic nucleotide-binding domain-containing protein [Pseudomonadota bacterium]